jgi:hypothetical protein
MGSKHFKTTGDERLEALEKAALMRSRMRAELVVDSREALASYVSDLLGRNIPTWTVRGWLTELIKRGVLAENATQAHGPVTRKVTAEDVLHWARTMLTFEQRRLIGEMNESRSSSGSGTGDQRNGSPTDG